MANKIHRGGGALVECINPNTNKWIVLWEPQIEVTERGEESTSYIAETFKYKPSLEEVKSTILSWYNSSIESEITNSYRWRDMPVWLSRENQLNYKAQYDLAVQTEGQSLPVTFKFGDEDAPVYYEFKNLEELTDFYMGVTKHIQAILIKGWESKDGIDWSIYKAILEERT